MSTTEIGKELRKLRIDEDERLIDMAGRLDRSAAFISAVETGKKSPPAGFEDLIVNVYRLGSAAAESIRKAADRSRKAFTVEPDNVLAKDAAGLFARRVNNLSQEDLTQILEILTKNENKL